MRGFWDELRRRGVAWSELQRRTGVRAPRSGDYFSAISRRDAQLLYEVAMELTGDPHLGLTVGKAVGVASFHLLGHLALAAPNLPDALALVGRAYRSLGVCFPVLEPGRDGGLRFGLPEANRSSSPAARCHAEFSAVLMRELSLNYLDPELAQPGVEFPFDAPADLEPYRRVFGSAPLFRSDGIWVTFPGEALLAKRSGSDAMLVDQLLRLAQDQYGSNAHSAEGWSLRVRNALRAHTAPRLVNLEEIATQLSLSRRRLVRRLAQEGTSLTALIDAELYDRAQALLRTGNTAAQVASALGYAELSSFFRAFRRWSGGVTPDAYRRRARDA